MSIGYDSSTVSLWRTLFDELDRNFLLSIILLHVQLFVCVSVRVSAWILANSFKSSFGSNWRQNKMTQSSEQNRKKERDTKREGTQELRKYYIRPDALSECVAKTTNWETKKKNWKRIFTHREIDDFFYRPKQKTKWRWEKSTSTAV